MSFETNFMSALDAATVAQSGIVKMNEIFISEMSLKDDEISKLIAKIFALDQSVNYLNSRLSSVATERDLYVNLKQDAEDKIVELEKEIARLNDVIAAFNAVPDPEPQPEPTPDPEPVPLPLPDEGPDPVPSVEHISPVSYVTNYIDGTKGKIHSLYDCEIYIEGISRKTYADIRSHYCNEVFIEAEVGAKLFAFDETVGKKILYRFGSDGYVNGTWDNEPEVPVTGLAIPRGNSRIFLWGYDPNENNKELRHSDPLVLYIHCQDKLPEPTVFVSKDVSDYFIHVTEYGDIPKTLVVTDGDTLDLPPLGILDLARIGARVSMATTHGYGKAWARSGDEFHNRVDYAMAREGEFSVDSGADSTLRGAFRMHYADVALRSIYDLKSKYDTAINTMAKSNHLRNYPVGLESFHDHPNPSKMWWTTYGYYRAKTAMGYALGLGLLREHGFKDISSDSVKRLFYGMSSYCRNVIKRFEQNWRVTGGYDYGMWSCAQLAAAYVMVSFFPELPEAEAIRQLTLTSDSYTSPYLKDIVKGSSFFGLFQPNNHFADRGLYLASKEAEPKMAAMLHIVLNVARKVGDAIPPHLIEFEKASVKGTCTSVVQQAGDLLNPIPAYTPFCDPSLITDPTIKDNVVRSYNAASILLSEFVIN